MNSDLDGRFASLIAAINSDITAIKWMLALMFLFELAILLKLCE